METLVAVAVAVGSILVGLAAGLWLGRQRGFKEGYQVGLSQTWEYEVENMKWSPDPQATAVDLE